MIIYVGGEINDMTKISVTYWIILTLLRSIRPYRIIDGAYNQHNSFIGKHSYLSPLHKFYDHAIAEQ